MSHDRRQELSWSHRHSHRVITDRIVSMFNHPVFLQLGDITWEAHVSPRCAGAAREIGPDLNLNRKWAESCWGRC